MAAATVPINPRVLAWAIEESGVSLPDLAQSTKTDVATLRSWLSGEGQPSRGQWTRLADKLKRPKSVFLLPAPPPPSVPPELRTAVGRDPHQLRPNEALGVRRARRLQRYLAALLQEDATSGTEIPFVKAGSDAGSAGAVLRDWTGVSVREQREWSSASVALRGWRSRLEELDLVVLQLQLGTDGMRGFSLMDPWAPVIGLNTAETNEATTFTLMHELAHLASRSEAACSAPLGASPGGSTPERWCDRVAAAVLLPSDAVRRYADEVMSGRRPPEDEVGLARRTATAFKTSLRAAGLRLIALDLASSDLYAAIETRYPNRDRDKPKGGATGGQPAPVRRLAEVGARTADVVLDAVADRRLTERDARSLLRLDGAELVELRSLTAS